MKQLLFLFRFLALTPVLLDAQIDLNYAWKFRIGDDPAFAHAAFDDSSWDTLSVQKNWEDQGHPDYDGFAWYRLHFTAPASMRDAASVPNAIRIDLGTIDDVDAVYLNGQLIGQTGRFQSDDEGYTTAWDIPRRYLVACGEGQEEPRLHWDADNVLAVRVFDDGGPGGFFGNTPRQLVMAEIIDFVGLSGQATLLPPATGDSAEIRFVLTNRYNQPVQGSINIDRGQGKKGGNRSEAVVISPGQEAAFTLRESLAEPTRVSLVFVEKSSGKSIRTDVETPYILTPPESPKPRINSAEAYGARPGAPFLFTIAATGLRPMRFSAGGLPAGLQIDERSGIISGAVADRGIFSVTLEVANSLGNSTKVVNFVIGDNICLTPPMGWSSWNCWGLSVSDAKVRASADAMVRKGLANHGWTYINIDDGWEAGRDSVTGEILPNSKFPDMKGLAAYLHGQGLKFGIYSSPGPRTCGFHTGSYQHELQDALTWGKWDVDFLKYDWCSYSGVTRKAVQDWTQEDLQKPYRIMRAALDSTHRDIVYSLCQYGMGEVWKWGADAGTGGNLWRTTGDIIDTWESMHSIGFSQTKCGPYAHPGHWNDPDMLIVGKVGWGDDLHPTRLTPSEQYTHMSLWALLSAPLLIGCDLAQIDAFTYNLLANDEVLAIDQDIAGKQAALVIDRDGYQVWVKELADGGRAVGIFNLSDQDQEIRVDWKELGLSGFNRVRDVWRQRDLDKPNRVFSATIFRHGAVLLKVD